MWSVAWAFFFFLEGVVWCIRTVEEDFGNVVGVHQREGQLEPGYEVVFGVDVLGYEKRSFVGVVADQDILAIDALFEQLLARQVLDEHAIGDGQETPGTIRAAGRDVKRSVLQRVSVLFEQTLENGSRRASVGCIGHAVCEGGERVVGLRWYPVLVLVLHGQVRGSGDGVFEERVSECAAVGHSLQHHRTTTGALTADGNRFWVSAELGNVGLHPLQGKGLIEDARVHDTVSEDFVAGQETKCSQAVLDGHTDEAVVVGVDDLTEVLSTVSESIT